MAHPVVPLTRMSLLLGSPITGSVRSSVLAARAPSNWPRGSVSDWPIRVSRQKSRTEKWSAPRNRSGPIGSALALTLALIFTLSAIGQAPVAPDLRNAIKQVDALAAAEFDKDNRGSGAIGVVLGPELAWTKSYGYADMENKMSATKDTVYRIGSITKPSANSC